jgi:GTP:adenosylcobinamide-phosphate guanylyltransferase
MIAVIMCGGKGSRFMTPGRTEKPLARIKGRTLIETVLQAVILSDQFSKILCVSSPYSPYTTQLLKKIYRSDYKIEVMVADGLGFSKDLFKVLNSMLEQKVFTFPSDLALLDSDTVGKLVKKCTPSIHNTCIAAVAAKSFTNALGMTCSSSVAIDGEDYCYSGVCGFYLGTSLPENALEESYFVINKIQLAVNVNTASDLRFAEQLSKGVNLDVL